MADESPEPSEVADGDVVRSTVTHLLGLTCVLAVIAAVSGFVLWDRWVNIPAERVLPFAVTWWGSALAAGGFLIGLFGAVAIPFDIVFPQYLVLSRDALQVVNTRRSGPAVIVEIPFGNVTQVARVRSSGGNQVTYVTLTLSDATDPDTYFAPGEVTRLAERDGAYTVPIPNGCDGEALAARVEKRVRKAKRSAGE